MKKIIFRFILIAGLITVIGACKSSDDSSTAAAGNIAGTGTTASGTITGNDNLTGVFHTSYYGQEPSGGCVDNSSALSTYSSILASDTLSFKKMWIITGDSTYTDSVATYSDANCSTLTSYFNKLYDNVTIGSGLTGLTAGSGPTFPTAGTKISITSKSYSLMANTTVSVAKFLSFYSATVTSGVEMTVDESSPATEYNIFATAPMSGSTKTYLYLDDGTNTDNYSDWTSEQDTYWKE